MGTKLLVLDPGIYKATFISGLAGLQFITYQDRANIAALKEHCRSKEIRLLHSSSRKPEQDANWRIAFNEDFDLTNLKSQCQAKDTEIIAITRNAQSLDFFSSLQQALKDINPKTKLTLANFRSKGGVETLDYKTATIPEPKAFTVGEFLANKIPVDPLTSTPEADPRISREELVKTHLDPITTNIPDCKVTNLTAWIDKAFGIKT